MRRSSRLRPLVRSIGVTTGEPPATRAFERVLPGGNVDLIVNLAEDELRTYDEDGTVHLHTGAVMSGPTTGPRIIDTDEMAAVLNVSFRHGAATAFLGPSVHELTNALVPLGELFGRDGATLRERLLAAGSVEARLDLVEDLLAAHADPCRAPSAATSCAIAALDRGVPVHAVGAELDVSPKQLVRLMRRHVGLAPKRYARIRRLQRVLASVHGRGDAGWAVVAAEHGYVDQSHLIRDVRDLTGLTPAAYMASATSEQNHVAFVLSGEPDHS